MCLDELHKLPAAEKMKIIEALWSDLVADEASFVSPAWHQEALRKTEEDFNAGRIEVLDWDDAKMEIQTLFPHAKTFYQE